MGRLPSRENYHQIRERCIFWPKCAKKEACPFAHPTTNCKNFPNCTYGNRCLFIHPNCRFDRYCTKKHCPFTHPGTGGYQPGSGVATSEVQNPLTSNRAPVSVSEETQYQKPRGALGILAEKLTASIKKKPVVEEKKEEKTDEKVESPEKQNNEDSSKVAPDDAPSQKEIPCRYAGECRNPACRFKHPKECRFGAKCRNKLCYYYHKPSSTAPSTTDTSTSSKYKWSATN